MVSGLRDGGAKAQGMTANTDLVVLARAGDHGAIADLLRTTQPDIRRYARRTCRLEDVDDAVQDSMWQVSRRIGALRAVSAFAGWVFAIVKRECYRLMQKARSWLPIAALDNDAALAVRPEAELRSDLAAAIQSLPPRYRTVVLRRDVEELTIDEIAALEGLSREAVKGRLRRARQAMREYLRD
jgi:RNA polymerase sigma factor (sigma-70 family)